jgi:hypothetical protein
MSAPAVNAPATTTSTGTTQSHGLHRLRSRSGRSLHQQRRAIRRGGVAEDRHRRGRPDHVVDRKRRGVARSRMVRRRGRREGPAPTRLNRRRPLNGAHAPAQTRVTPRPFRVGAAARRIPEAGRGTRFSPCCVPRYCAGRCSRASRRCAPGHPFSSRATHSATTVIDAARARLGGRTTDAQNASSTDAPGERRTGALCVSSDAVPICTRSTEFRAVVLARGSVLPLGAGSSDRGVC